MEEFKPNKYYEFPVCKNTERLKELIAEHPDYDIVVLVGEETNGGDYSWMFCRDISFKVTELLTVETPYNDEVICCDKDEFEDGVQDWLEETLYDDGIDLSDKEFDKRLKAEIQKYDPYWKNVIAIYASN